ncbi:aldose epimerase [Coraliomargarita sinensis]|uniref:Aldose epimerase n=1 Tax=Coraliomargarita sinensis TaxID=2174842 RepID=A0A317ZN24_9BACT|nr:aldose epimerase [Coraliomargarita sinensis]PXA05643.1 aldose epimerase [Coraliomargarita sinensis]
MEIIEHEGLKLHRWNCGPSTYLACPERGGRLMNWNLRMADGSVRDIIHWSEGADYGNLAKVRGGNPILFPFCARTYHKGKVDEWKAPDGSVRPMPRHGFARGGRFEVVSADEHGFAAELKPDDAAREAYPFQYRFTVRYKFEALSFRVYLRLENFDETPIPWSAGHHFYFTLPWHEGLERKDYRFHIPAKKCFAHAPDGSLELIKPFDKESDFGRSEHNDRIYTKLKDNLASFGPNNGEEDIGIRFLKDADTYSQWNAFAIWTESEGSPFYCVEPWMGPPNSPEHRKGLHAVNPGESAEFGVEVSLL